MFRQVTFEKFKTASFNQKRAVVFQEFPCDDMTPIHAFLALNAKKGAVLLESAIKDEDLGRYSLIAIEPFAEFKSGDLADLRQEIQSHRLSAQSTYPPMVGGAIGFATYDAIRLFEKVPDRHPNQDSLPPLFFLFHAVHIAFDHLKGTLIISVIVETSEDPEKDYAGALKKIDEIRATMKTPLKAKEGSAQAPANFVEEMSDEEFCQRVEKAKEYLRKGDAFQVVISRKLSCPFEGSPFEIYRALRMTNPSPFMFYIETEDFAIAGSSPERLVKLENGMLQTMPIAGTRPRVAGEEEKIIEALMRDEKEDAEHMMLVDLGRNDLGVVAKIGTVQVKELKKPRLFPHVIHLVSQIEAKIEEKYDALDALKAVFPAGTLSGAPKIRAMEIIDELENSRRGVYGGAICTIDNNGHLDSCIAIRTAFIKNGIVSVRAGAGIVLDSDPMKEAEETRAKAKGVIRAIELAKGEVL